MRPCNDMRLRISSITIHDIFSLLDESHSFFPPGFPNIPVLLQESTQLGALFHLPMSTNPEQEMTHDYSRDFLPRLDCPDIIEHLRQFGFRQFLRPGECLHDVRLGFLCQFDILRLRPPPFGNQESSESVNRVIYPLADIDHIVLTNNIPFLNFFDRSILA
jgi:hypothetical protein